ncbi:MAG: leucine-rich repeat domain-containing protein [Bacteroidota bacterium]
MKQFISLLIMALLIGIIPVSAQTKPTSSPKKKSATASPAKQPQKKTSTTGQKKPAAGGKANALTSKAGMIDVSKIDTFRLQVIPLVKFFESSLNFIGDKRNDVSDMQTIISTSYLKWCWDDKVQVEDDLDENRLVPLYKDMPAYLSDVDFFFKGAKFLYSVQDVSLEANPQGFNYFKVTANRNLRALTINGDSVNSNKVRYIEINYDSIKQQLKIVSVYTTKLNEKEDMRNWWNNLSPEWKGILAADMKLEGTLPMAQIDSFNDSLAMVGGKPTAIMGSEFYAFLDQIVHSTKVNLSGRKTIADLAPLNKLSGLKNVNISGTAVSDLMPLRNMNELESLDISNTKVSSLEPLRYCILINQLRMRGAPVGDISVIKAFQSLSLLDIGNTPVSSLDDLSELTGITDLRVDHTRMKDLTPIAGLTNIEMLNISSTSVDNLSALKNMKNLHILMSDSTAVSSLTPLDSLAGLQRIFCNNSKINQKAALNFLKKHPDVSLVYASKELAAWWDGMTLEWQDQFNFYMTLNNPPTTEQLHKLVLLDSINITGRATIVSLDPMSKMILLKVLYCPSTGITSLDPLKDLTELRVVNVSNTKVTTLQPLSGSANLITIYLDNTPVADLTPLYNLKNLRNIYADNTGVDDNQADKFAAKIPGCLLVYQTYENTDWWKGLSKAWKDVLLQQVKITGIPDKNQLQQISGLPKVIISENFEISDISALLHLTRLTELQFSGTTVSKLDPVAQMSKLQILRCPKNPITLLTPIAGLSALIELDFSNTQVEDIDALQNMIQLETLKFSGTQVKNLKYLQKLVNLKVIEFFNTRVGNVDVLDEMKKLQSVKMFNTKVSAKRVEKLKMSHPGCEVVYY